MTVLVIGMLVLLGAAVPFLPLRGGNGDHAHAGPGTVTVHWLRELVTAQPGLRAGRAAEAERPTGPRVPELRDAEVPAAEPCGAGSRVRGVGMLVIRLRGAAEPADGHPEPDPAPTGEEIAWPEQDWADYVGKHRLRVEQPLFHRLATLLTVLIHGRPNEHCTGDRYQRPEGPVPPRPRSPVPCDAVFPGELVAITFAR